MLDIIQTHTSKDLDKLYKDSALTLEGLDLKSLPDFIDWIKENSDGMFKERVYVTTGALMNMYCGNTGKNAYPDDLNIVSVMLNDIKGVAKLFTKLFEIGGRWFDDIVDNNRRRG